MSCDDRRLVVAFFGVIISLVAGWTVVCFFFSVVQVRHTNATLARDDRRFPSPRYRIAFLNFPGDPSMRLSCSSSPCRPCFRNPYFFSLLSLLHFERAFKRRTLAAIPFSGDRGLRATSSFVYIQKRVAGFDDRRRVHVFFFR